MFLKENLMHEYTSQEVGKLAKGLINVQRQLQPGTKDANNPFTEIRYATLASWIPAVRRCSPTASNCVNTRFLPNWDVWGWSPNSLMPSPGNGNRAVSRFPCPRLTAGRGYFHDLYAPLCALSHTRYHHGRGYGRAVLHRRNG